MPSQIVGLNRQLNWAAFRVKNSPPPGDGVFGNAALTQADFRVSGLNLVAVDPGKSKDLKLEDKIVVTVSLNPAVSWVASWVKQRLAPEQARLLKHEQGHYDLVALLARDYFEELMSLRQKTYTDGDELQTDVTAITQRFSAKSGPVQERYDDDTEHGGKQPNQDRWNRMISSASDDDMDPATPAVSSPMRKKPLLSVLSAAAINI
jgi:hypothetical protein